jgi:hypothetical protein
MDTRPRYSSRWSVIYFIRNPIHFNFPIFLATGVALIALALSFSQHITVTLVSSLVSFLAALLTVIAFAIDIALYAYVKHEMGNLTSNESTITGPGW